MWVNPVWIFFPLSGVLLLNSVLTVRSHQPTSHEGQGWELFTDAVVQWLSSSLDSLVFLLWGSYAQRKGRVIDRVSWFMKFNCTVFSLYSNFSGNVTGYFQKRHHILETSHPSPYSAHLGFFGCRHFSKTNMLLKKSGKNPVDWTAFW